MNRTCPKCKTSQSPDARFCAECGTSLSATLVQGRTLVMPSTRTEANRQEGIDVHTIVQRARASYGTEPASPTKLPDAIQPINQPEDTFLVLDCSGSMGEELDPGVTKIEGAIRAGVNLVMNKHSIDPDDRVGVVSFTERAELLMDLSSLSTDKPEVIRTLQALTSDGGTDINAGLAMSRDQFDWSSTGVVRRIVLLTDGHGGHPKRTAKDLKDKGVVIDVIAIGPTPAKVNEELLREVATPGHYRFIKDARTLVQHFTQLAKKTATCP